jgi:hypothetical protein
MELGSVAWIAARLAEAGGPVARAALASALPPEFGPDLDNRLLTSPLFVRTTSGEAPVWALMASYLAGATFRYALGEDERQVGALRLEGREAMLAVQQRPGATEPEVAWRDADGAEPQRARLARGASGWALPGLGAFYAAHGLVAGDDVLVHVRDLEGPTFVLAVEPRLDRDEAAVERTNVKVLAAALALLQEDGGGWTPVDRLVKRLVARHDYRLGTPPDAFAERLLVRDDRFTLARDGHAVRPSHFRREDTTRAYLARVGSPHEALPAFLEEYPPSEDADREKALALLTRWWRDAPRAELGGMTPNQADEEAAKIIPFPRRS